MTRFAVIAGKCISKISSLLHFGAGATWPGEVALRLSPHILSNLSSSLTKGIILVAGTNGKTTTALMISHILRSRNKKVILNSSGANLLNGVVSAFIQHASWEGNIDADFGVFEVDENSLPLVISNIKYQISKAQIKNKKVIIVFLNLFRDQLDRYGEVDIIAEKWVKALKNLPRETKIILNADDPLIAHLGKAMKSSVSYFGLDDPKLFQKQMEHATDSIFCLNCGNRLTFTGIYYSHLGIWRCTKCGEKRPKPDVNEWQATLPGVYNRYNTLASVAVVKSLGLSDETIKKALSDFSPAFGRQEEFEVNGKEVKIFLSKNPAGFNESLRTILSLGAKEILFVLNDRIPDGRDVSWIWDVDFEMIPDDTAVIISGERIYDMALRIKYSVKSQISNLKSQNQNLNLKIFENLEEAISSGLNDLKNDETLYVLPTYSAMLEVRKILIGRKIL